MLFSFEYTAARPSGRCDWFPVFFLFTFEQVNFLPFAVVSTEFPKNCLKLGELSGAEFAFRALKLLPISLLLFVCVPLIRLEVFFLFFLLLLFFHCPLSLLASLFALPLIQFALFPFFFLFSIQLRVIEKEKSAASEFCGGYGGF